MGTVTAIVPSAMLVGDEFAAYMRDAEPEAKVLPVTAFRDQFYAQRASGQKLRAPTLPWHKTHENLQFRGGEVTLWAGTNGSGKSMVVSHALLGFMLQDVRCLSMSFEMKPYRQIERMARQFSGCKEPTDAAIDQLFDWAGGRLWFYDQQGRVNPRMVFAVIRFAALRLGVTQFVVDSLMKVVRGEDDYNGQKDFVDDLTSLARDLDVHVHLVHHTKKLDDESRVPTKGDAKGAGGITDQVDNVIMPWRNKPKELLKSRHDQGQHLTEKELEKLDGPDMVLNCDKQRNHDWEGRIALWFNRESWQYIGDARCRPVSMLDLVTSRSASHA